MIYRCMEIIGGKGSMPCEDFGFARVLCLSNNKINFYLRSMQVKNLSSIIFFSQTILLVLYIIPLYFSLRNAEGWFIDRSVNQVRIPKFVSWYEYILENSFI